MLVLGRMLGESLLVGAVGPHDVDFRIAAEGETRTIRRPAGQPVVGFVIGKRSWAAAMSTG